MHEPEIYDYDTARWEYFFDELLLAYRNTQLLLDKCIELKGNNWEGKMIAIDYADQLANLLYACDKLFDPDGVPYPQEPLHDK